jgi:hypothetical protein
MAMAAITINASSAIAWIGAICSLFAALFLSRSARIQFSKSR